MTAVPPIACSLSATDLPARLAEMTALGAAALASARTEPTRAELRFAAAPGVRERVEAIVAAESRCCPFLSMRVEDEPRLVVLTIAAPEGAESVVEELAAAFRGEPDRPR
jgi:MerR family copper efflux transcriptional regulator